MKLYHAIENGKVTSSVQEDYDKIKGWSVGKEIILQEEVSRDNSVLKVVDGVVSIDEDFIIARDKDTLRKQYKSERDEALYSATVELDGMVFQTRPSDITNFTVGISKGSIEWVLADNSVATVTTDQLQSVLDSAQDQAKSIFDDYMTGLKSL